MEGVERAEGVVAVLTHRGLPCFPGFSIAVEFLTASPIPLQRVLGETAAGVQDNGQSECSAAAVQVAEVPCPVPPIFLTFSCNAVEFYNPCCAPQSCCPSSSVGSSPGPSPRQPGQSSQPRAAEKANNCVSSQVLKSDLVLKPGRGPFPNPSA